VTATASATLLMPLCSRRLESASKTISLASLARTTCGVREWLSDRSFQDRAACACAGGRLAPDVWSESDGPMPKHHAEHPVSTVAGGALE
jgi:hypothetical protein